MRVKWQVAVIYIGLAAGAIIGSYAARHRPLGPPGSLNQALKESRETNDQQQVHPSELPYRGTVKVPVENSPTPALTRVPRIGTRTRKHVEIKPAPRPAPRRERRVNLSCSHIPAAARGLDRDTIIQYAPRYGLNSEQTEDVLRCLHK